MKKILSVVICFCLLFTLFACGKNDGVKKTVKGNMKTYYEMDDGTWLCDNYSYKYCLKIEGRLNAAVSDTFYVYLSNKPEISFEEASKASGISSNSEDYFSPEEAVLVDFY